jgi:hypothetical protein
MAFASSVNSIDYGGIQVVRVGNVALLVAWRNDGRSNALP